MFRILYSSIATRPMSENDLQSLLASARVHNQDASVTGMLVYNGGDFLQVLEGEASKVLQTFNRIERDPRHQKDSITTLQRGSFGGRLFDGWSMGFKVIGGSAAGSVAINSRIKLRHLDELAALDFLVECSRSQDY
jgi:hypothetical protein